MRDPTRVAVTPRSTVLIEGTPSLVALLAAAGLLALTISAAVRATSEPQLFDSLAMIMAWVAVLASALVGRQGSGGQPPGGDSPEPPPARTRNAAETVAPAAPPVAPLVSRPDPDLKRQDEPWFEALLEFAQETLSALGADRLRLLIAEKLPAIVDREDVWVVASVGGNQQVILPMQPDREQPRLILSDQPRQWATFPLKADGETVGVLGLELASRGITAREWRMLTAVAGVLGRALKTSAAFEAMREATLVDPLTGCSTRAEGLRRFEAELRRAERSKSALAVLMIDLDHFKSINDRYGHNTGDAVLSAVGETLLGTLRASDIRSRWGGEEFLVVLPESTIERACAAAESLRQRIASAAVRDGFNTVRVTTSIGITITRPGDTDIPRLLGRADAALYRAKSEGRNRIMVSQGDYIGGTPAPAPADPPMTAAPANPPERRAHGDRRASVGRRRTDLLPGPWGGNS